jgi:hypothetical protein
LGGSADAAVERGGGGERKARTQRQLQHLRGLQGALEAVGGVLARHRFLEGWQADRAAMERGEAAASQAQVSVGLRWGKPGAATVR